MGYRSRNKQPTKRWGESHISEGADVTIHRQREYVGYGFSNVYFIGALEAVKAALEQHLKSYHPSWYSGSYDEPEDLGNGLFLIFGRHSESCE